jgi:hypothetical protein
MDPDYSGYDSFEILFRCLISVKLSQGMASDWDLALFREAQAKACQAIEDQLKGLPDVKGTKYIEMGRFEIEVRGHKVHIYKECSSVCPLVGIGTPHSHSRW